ncbi:MAG: hypothetical protein ABI639_08440 [Thermoanaerobaculia bacterium]
MGNRGNRLAPLRHLSGGTSPAHEERAHAGDVARALRSSQSRVAKMEAAEPSVSLDLLIRSLLALRVRSTGIASAIARAAR